MSALFSQFRCGKEHIGRTDAVKAVAYETGEAMREEQSNRVYSAVSYETGEKLVGGEDGRVIHYQSHAGGKGVIYSGVRVPSNAPAALLSKSFPDLRGHAQALLNSICRFETTQRARHKGRNQTGHNNDDPIIGRQDLINLDRRLVYDEQGNKREGWRKNLQYVADDIVREKWVRRGIPVIYAIHDEENGNGNFHIHVTSLYRELTPDGWAKNKSRPYGKTAWRDYWLDGAKITRAVQTRFLNRLGVAAKSWPTDRASMPPRRGSIAPALQLVGAVAAAASNDRPRADVQAFRAASRKATVPDGTVAARAAPIAVSKTTIRQGLPPPTGSPDSATRHAAGVDPNITGRAQAAFDYVMARYAGAIEDAAKDPSLNPEQRAAAVAGLRQRAQLEAAGARKRVVDEEHQNAKVRRRNYRALQAPPKPS